MKTTKKTQSSRLPKGNSLRKKKTIYRSLRLLRLVHPFFTQLMQPPEIICFTMLFNQPDTPRYTRPFLWRHLHPRIIRVTRNHQLSIQTASQSVQPFLHSSRQRVPILYNVH